MADLQSYGMYNAVYYKSDPEVEVPIIQNFHTIYSMDDICRMSLK